MWSLEQMKITMEYYNDILCIEANKLWQTEIVSFDAFQKLKQRNKIRVVRRGCLNTPALVAYDSIPERFRKLIKEKCGEVETSATRDTFESQIIDDAEARKFFRAYRLDDGRSLPVDTIEEYCANASILNTLKLVSTNRIAKHRVLGGNKNGIWEKLSETVNQLNKDRFPHSLPTNLRRLRDKYARYQSEGYQSLIHTNFCNKNTEKVTDDAK